MKHAMVKMLCGQLYFAPIGENPHEVLDIGTGTGIWAIESMPHGFLLFVAIELTSWPVGDLFPSSNILGVDLSPIQPEWVPPNVRFMVDDIEYVVSLFLCGPSCAILTRVIGARMFVELIPLSHPPVHTNPILQVATSPQLFRLRPLPPHGDGDKRLAQTHASGSGVRPLPLLPPPVSDPPLTLPALTDTSAPAPGSRCKKCTTSPSRPTSPCRPTTRWRSTGG